MNMLTYAERLTDPLLRKALDLNGFEESRHKEVLANLVAAYGITLQPEPVYPRHADAEWAYLITGYSECIDSFFAFGLFELAKRSGFFPPALARFALRFMRRIGAPRAKPQGQADARTR